MILALLLAAAVAGAPPCAAPGRAGPARPWKSGELLTFDLRVMGMVQAGTLSLKAEAPMFRGTLLPIRARVNPMPTLARVRNGKGYAMTWLDARTLLPDRYRDEAAENGVHKLTDVHFPRSGEQVNIDWEYGTQKGTTTFARAGEVFDVISAIYYLRSAELTPGQEICFDLVGARRFWRLNATVAKRRERVETDAGIFETVRLDGTAVQADAPTVRRPIHVWISTDARRLLVAAVTEIDVGPLSARLLRAESGTRE